MAEDSLSSRGYAGSHLGCPYKAVDHVAGKHKPSRLLQHTHPAMDSTSSAYRNLLMYLQRKKSLAERLRQVKHLARDAPAHYKAGADLATWEPAANNPRAQLQFRTV